jgi:carboxymethylenebutenolidase
MEQVMIGKQIDITTADGTMRAFVTHPDRGGPFPVIIVYMDARGFREELRDMARRFATVGYYCILPDLYYRWGSDLSFPPSGPLDDRAHKLVEQTTNDLVVRDTKPLLAYIKNDPAAAAGPRGAVGYCMGGRLVVAAMGAYPDDIKAGASLYGVGLCTEKPDSPHLTAGKLKGELYFGFGELDKYTPANEIEGLREALIKAKVPFEIEMHAGAGHGYSFAERTGAYHKQAAERSWARIFSLFQRQLGRK